MTRKMAQEKTTEEKRALDVRRGFLAAHAALSVLLVIGSQTEFWSIWVKGTLVETVLGREHDGIHGKITASYMAISAIFAFFFTTYDLVANADVQWPPLLASAFALGCCTQQVWQTFHKDVDRLETQYVQDAMFKNSIQEAKEKMSIAATTSGGGSVAPVMSATTPDAAASYDFKIRPGSGLVIAFGSSLGMLLLSIYLTFFAKRRS